MRDYRNIFNKVVPYHTDNSMSLYEFVGRLYEYLKDFEGSLDEAHEKIDEFVKSFIMELDETTNKILTEWHDDGTLAELINLVWDDKAEKYYVDNLVNQTANSLMNKITDNKQEIDENTTKINALYPYEYLENGTDLHTVGVGVHALGSTGQYVNGLDESTMYGVLSVTEVYPRKFLVFHDVYNRVYIKVYSGTTWSSWEKLVSGSEFNQVVGENTTKIGENTTKINENTAKIGANTTKIDGNTTKINANTTKTNENTTKIGALYPSGNLPSGTDLHTVGAGVHALGSNDYVNGISQGVSMYGVLSVTVTSPRRYLTYHDMGNNFYVKTYNGTAWSAWKEITGA